MIMILTDDCRVDFEKWLNDNYNSETIFSTATGDYEGGYFENDHTIHDLALYFEKVPYLLNALIIEWFDSIGIYISINYVSFYDELRNDKGFEAYVTNNGLSVKFRSLKNRKAAAKQAIIKANDIYNETNA